MILKILFNIYTILNVIIKEKTLETTRVGLFGLLYRDYDHGGPLKAKNISVNLLLYLSLHLSKCVHVNCHPQLYTIG